MRISPQLIVGILCGGLAGAVFTWWMNHPRETVVSYHVSNTTLGGVKGLFPNLRIKIGNDEIDTVYIHLVEFVSEEGPYVDSVNPVIAFERGARFYGQVVSEQPSPAHHMDCQRSAQNVTCSLGPLTGKSERFRISIATGSAKDPSVYLFARGVVLTLKTPRNAGDETWSFVSGATAVLAALSLFIGIYSFWESRRTLLQVKKFRDLIRNRS